jgi:hypothetical protein
MHENVRKKLSKEGAIDQMHQGYLFPIALANYYYDETYVCGP